VAGIEVRGVVLGFRERHFNLAAWQRGLRAPHSSTAWFDPGPHEYPHDADVDRRSAIGPSAAHPGEDADDLAIRESRAAATVTAPVSRMDIIVLALLAHE
jgi:hypothetical protein